MALAAEAKSEVAVVSTEADQFGSCREGGDAGGFGGGVAEVSDESVVGGGVEADAATALGVGNGGADAFGDGQRTARDEGTWCRVTIRESLLEGKR